MTKRIKANGMVTTGKSKMINAIGVKTMAKNPTPILVNNFWSMIFLVSLAKNGKNFIKISPKIRAEIKLKILNPIAAEAKTFFG